MQSIHVLDVVSAGTAEHQRLFDVEYEIAHPVEDRTPTDTLDPFKDGSLSWLEAALVGMRKPRFGRYGKSEPALSRLTRWSQPPCSP
jgi:hypothetical protein